MLQISEVVDLLSVFTNPEIQHGLQQYQIAGPRNANGFLRKPAPGDLYQFIMNIRGMANAKTLPTMPDAVRDTTPLSLKPINPDKKASAEKIMKAVAEAAECKQSGVAI